MSEIKKIMVPTDFSGSAETAMTYVANLTRESKEKEVTFIHAVSEEESLEEVGNQLSEFKKRFNVTSEANCNVMFERGELNDVILKSHKALNQDLIVMGTKGAVSEDDVTNTSNLVMEADCPVLVIPENVSKSSIKNIALALGKGEIDDSFALGVLHGLARENDAKIHILTIDNDIKGDLQEEDTNESVLEYYLDTLDYRHVFPKNSDIEMGIAAYIEEHNIDLLAILPRNHAKKSKPSEGRLTKLLTLHSKIPVLAID